MESRPSARSSPILDITKFGWDMKSGLPSPSLDIFMIIIMHSFLDIEDYLFFYNGGPHLHEHNMHIILQHLSDSMIILDHGDICVDTNFMILSCIICQILTKLGFSIMAVLICIHIYAYS